MRRSTLVVGLAAALLLMGLIAGTVSFVTANSRLSSEQSRSSSLEANLLDVESDNAQQWWRLAMSLESVEPTSSAALIGVYRARIVEVRQDGSVLVDWLGYSPDPHGAQPTNLSAATQTLRPDPLSGMRIRATDGSTELV